MERDLTGRCGTCAFYTAINTGDDGKDWGECRLGCWPSPLSDESSCPDHKPIGASWEGALKRKPAAGTPRRYRDGGPSRPRGNGPGRAPAVADERPPIPAEIGIDMDQQELRTVLREVLLDELGVRDIEMGDRWRGGELVMQPGKTETQEKRVPIDAFFHKIVMVRDRLRVLEQKVNGSKSLSNDEKVQLQQYITSCYGSLTSFNVLFKNKDDQFRGQGGKG